MEIRTIQPFLHYFGNVRERTMRVARCIPADKVEWTYREGQFTLGDLVRHIATINRYMYGETVSGLPSRYAGCGKELADGYEQVLAFAERMQRESVAIFSQLTPEQRAGYLVRCAFGDAATLLKFFKEVGECTPNLRMTGRPPCPQCSPCRPGKRR